MLAGGILSLGAGLQARLGPLLIDGHSVLFLLSLALLVYLAATGRAHARQKLAALLWPDFSEAQARQALRTALADIRRALALYRLACLIEGFSLAVLVIIV